MFKNLPIFPTPYSGKETFGFYLAYLLFIILLSLFAGLLASFGGGLIGLIIPRHPHDEKDKREEEIKKRLLICQKFCLALLPN